MDYKERFKEFILNDIFWFDKSELNFGIYKIFRQKERLIKEKLDEIVENVERQLSENYRSAFEALKSEVVENYVPKKRAGTLQIENIEDLEKVINEYGNGDTEALLSRLKVLSVENNHSAVKVYEYLYQFFNLYYEKGDFGYTKRSFRSYVVPYTLEEYCAEKDTKVVCESSHSVDYRGEETLFTWKTKDSYYIKSNKFLNSVAIDLNYETNPYTIQAHIVEKDENIRDDKKVKQYRLVSVQKKGNLIELRFNISDYATPKHAIYLAILAMMETDMDSLDYDAIFADKKSRAYFEELPFLDKKISVSLFDENQKKFQKFFKKKLVDENFKKYLLNKDKNIFKHELKGEEDKTQIKSKVSKLMIGKKEYASAVYSKAKAKAFLGIGTREKFDFDDKDDLKRLYVEDSLLDFFYKLDRGINLFYAGVDSDYFIHKNLKRFLSVELDKFIKNYIFVDTSAILNMDESVKKIATFAKVFKEQAEIFIELLSAIEEFQKYLWNKRKMVKSSHYIVSSNKIKDDMLLERVLENEAQLEEWRSLGIVREGDIPNAEELKNHSYPIDTKYFDNIFKYQVLSLFDDIEEELSGLLIKSENYQALRFLEPKYTDKKGDGKIKCVYIDPPYNTGNDGFVYKDNFKSASWLSMMQDRLEVAKRLMREDGVIFTSIDDNQLYSLKLINDLIFEKNNFIGTIVWRSTQKNDPKNIAINHEYILAYLTNIEANKKNRWRIPHPLIKDMLADFDRLKRKFSKNKEKLLNEWRLLIKKKYKDLEHYKHFDDRGVYFAADISDPQKKGPKHNFVIHPITGKVCKAPAGGYSPREAEMKRRLANNEIHFGETHETVVCQKKYLETAEDRLNSVYYEDGRRASNLLKELFDKDIFNNPKSERLIGRLIAFSTSKEEKILDFFGGSGTTAHAVINLNKEDGGKRKFTLVEMNDYFDSIILPRVKKVSFASEWKKGQAQNKDGYSGIFQYIELEQYDDIIDNLEVIEGVDYSEIDFGYIYEPDKNQINFRMKKELEMPFDDEAKFDIFQSLVFHEGLVLKTLRFNDDVLEAAVTDRYAKPCVVILGNDKKKVEKRIKDIAQNGEKIYTNHKIMGAEQILAETFKGR